MLAFVVPLKSARSSSDWTLVTRLVNRTLRSACAQTSPEFRVIVACHDIPELDFRDPRLKFIQPDCPDPGSDPVEQRLDKSRKVLAGLRSSSKSGPCHAMVLDADDCVSNRLAAFVDEHPGENGWYFRSGYMSREGQDFVRLDRMRFHRWCGSSHIFKPGLLDLAPGSEENWRFKHGQLARQLRQKGRPLSALPFPGAVYNVSHGENFYHYAPLYWPRNPLRRWINKVIFDRPLTPEIREEFGLYALDEHGP